MSGPAIGARRTSGKRSRPPTAAAAAKWRRPAASIWRPWITPEALLLGAERQSGEARVEAREAAAAVEQLLRAAGPGRVRVGIDVEVEGRSFRAIGRAGVELI